MIFCSCTCKLPNFDPAFFLNNLINLPRDTIYLFDSPNIAWYAMEQLFNDVGNKHAPLRSMRVRGDQSQWMSIEIQEAVKIHEKLKQEALKNNLQSNFLKPDNAVFNPDTITGL